MQSAAYDLSIYEPKPKRQAEQSPKVRVVAQHSQEELARPKMLAKAVGLVILLTVSLCCLLYTSVFLSGLDVLYSFTYPQLGAVAPVIFCQFLLRGKNRLAGM